MTSCRVGGGGLSAAKQAQISEKQDFSDFLTVLAYNPPLSITTAEIHLLINYIAYLWPQVPRTVNYSDRLEKLKLKIQ